MQPMSAAEIRERFQRFFEERGHTRVASAPLQARAGMVTEFDAAEGQAL